MRNDPVCISRSAAAENFSSSVDATRKPGIIAIFTSYLRKTVPDCQHYDFEDWCAHLSQSSAEDENAAGKTKRVWLDVLQSWELKVSKTAFNVSRIDTKYTMVGLTDPEEPDPSVVQPVTSIGGKRKASHPLRSGSGKRSRSTRTTKAIRPSKIPDAIVPGGASGSNSCSHPPLSITTDEQCAYYAIERLSAAWNITHCTVVQLSGECVINHIVVYQSDPA